MQRRIGVHIPQSESLSSCVRYSSSLAIVPVLALRYLRYYILLTGGLEF